MDMDFSKIILCIWVTLFISTSLGAPPRNVIEMKEEENNVDINVAEQPEKVLKVEDLEPKDHLDAVRLEQDGMLNKDYKKEIFIGEHEEIDNDETDMAESKLKDIFMKIDADQDDEICAPEIESWIIDRTQQHFDEAVEENNKVFKHMDPDGNGLVHWKEYYVHFLLAKGFPLERANKHMADYDEIELDFEAREALIRYKFKWTDADVDPMDNQLNIREFLAFRHPEQSDVALDNMIKIIIESLDKDEDGILVEDEFVSMPLGEIDDEEQKKLDKEWRDERKTEFNDRIDHDRNGKVTKEELKKYIDPRNPDQAKTDTKNLLKEMDDDGDNCLSWKEVVNLKHFFINSKLVNIKKVLHDEF